MTTLDFNVIARDRASKTFDKIGGSVDGTSKKMGRLKVAAGIAGGAVAAAVATIGRDAVRNASQAEQSLGATETVFGKFSAGVVKTSQKASTQFGLSANDYRENANVIGSILKNQGVSNEQLAGKTQSLIQKGADLSAVFGGSAKDAVDALSSAFKGEFDPIERYGISLKQSSINSEALKQAHVKSTAAFNKLTPAAQAAAKQQATLALINKQSASTTGQFAKQTSTTAERVQIAKAKYTDLTAQIGTKLLPVMNTLLGIGSAVLTFFSKYGSIITPIVAVLGTLAGIIYTILTVTKIWTSVQAAFNIVMSMNPIGLVIIGIALLVAGMIVAYKKSETFRNIVNGAFKAIGTAVKFMWDSVIKPVFKLWINAWFTVIGAILTGAAKAFGWIPGIGPKLKAASKKFNEFRDSVNRSLDGIKDQKVNVKIIASVNNSKLSNQAKGKALDIAFRASGGPVRAGSPYVVGENGPELFVPGQSGGIVPNGQTSKAMSNSGGGDFTATAPLVLNVEGREIYRGLLTFMRKSGKTSLALG